MPGGVQEDVMMTVGVLVDCKWSGGGGGGSGVGWAGFMGDL